jgi:cation:H+ antiporter
VAQKYFSLCDILISMTLFWIVALIFSIALLTKGADFVLDGAHEIGSWLGLSSFGAGAIIIGSLTSLPDLAAAFVAQLEGASDIVTGTAVGANIADIFLIAAIIAILARGVKITSDDIHFDVSWLIASTFALVLVMWDGIILKGESFFLLVLFGLYFATTYAIAREKKKAISPEERTQLSVKNFWLLVIGLILLITGAYIAVNSAINLAESFKISTGIIGLFAIALGTTLPEFFVTIRSANGSRAPLAMGNIFGSNIFNALAVVGVPGMLAPIVPDPVTATLGVSFMVIATGVFVYSILTKRQISKREGMFYLGGYILFIILGAGYLG